MIQIMLSAIEAKTRREMTQYDGVLGELFTRARLTTPGMLLETGLKLARLAGGMWLVSWGILRISRAVFTAALGLGGLSIFGGLSLLGMRSSTAKRPA